MKKWTIVAALLAFVPGVEATTFKWSAASDIPTWDIHAQSNSLLFCIHSAVYESLVAYNSRNFKIEPVLATSWKQLTPTQLRLNLRQGVKFHDGTPFTADDAVFSLERAMGKTSNFNIYTQNIEKIIKIDNYTIDIISKGPNPVLLNEITELRMMGKFWAGKNKSLLPKDMKTDEENYAHNHANGTGPFILQSWKPDQKMVLTRNTSWWGKKEGNITEIEFTPIKSAAARIAALEKGELDFVLDPNPEDIPKLRNNSTLKVLNGIENRTVFLGMDFFRDELPGSNIKGKNPLKDLRVRKALYQAIDIQSISKMTLRGLGEPTGALVAPQVNGWSESIHTRYTYNLEAAKKLLSQAGYAEGFEIDLACPNNRYVNDAQVCQAIVGMWNRIGVRAKLRTLPLVNYFPMIQRYEASVFMLGWSVPTFDAMYSLQSLARSVGSNGDGNYNVGRYSNPQLDALVERAKKETNSKLRKELLNKGLILTRDDISHLPLYNQAIPWAMKKNIEVIHRADNMIDWRILKAN
jgi:peptide/nickel transport system substrate-binding protein